MATQAAARTDFEKWQDGIEKAVGDVSWNIWDCEIQTAVNEYNQHLSKTAKYKALDWQIIKAITWVETGAESKKWMSNPMQIGNPGDPGLNALLSGGEGGDLILPPESKSMTAALATRIPACNIRAGIGYLLMRMAKLEIANGVDADATIAEVTVRAGDSFDMIAREHGSTIETLIALNPKAHVLQPGQVLKYQKAARKKVIVGWRSITTLSIAMNYNFGDSLYAKKLDYALALVRNGKMAICPHQEP